MGNKSEKFYQFTAKALHDLGKYEEAARYYKKYLNKIKRGPRYDEVVKAIKQCGFARNFQYSQPTGYADNLGRILNTKNDEERVVESLNYPNRIYFTSNRKEAFASQDTEEGVILHDELDQPTKDIFYSNEVNGKWTEIEGFNIFLNTSKNEKLHDFSLNGRVVFFQSGTRNTDDWLLVDTAKEVRSEIRPSKLDCPINMALGDTDVKVLNDTTLLFASDNLEGFGGYDLFFTTRNDDGSWNIPINLGPEINSSSDERSPFVSKNGKKLYFSSNRVESFGGLDIFSTEFINQKWQKPTNLGFGINSSRDDLDFRLVGNGEIGYLTSNRSDGLGGLDIYRVGINTPDRKNNSGRLDVSFLNIYERPKPPTEEEALVDEFIEEIGDDERNVIYPEPNSVQLEEVPDEVKEEPVVKEPVMRQFIIDPLYYDEDEFLQSRENTKVIDRIAEIYKLDPDVQIVLISHSLDEDDVAFDLYLSAKRGERMLKQFKRKGISSDNVVLLGVGSNYPMVKAISDGERVESADRINRRFDLMIFPSLDSYVDVLHREPKIDDSKRDVRHDAFMEASDGLSYRVKVEESSKVINKANYNNLQDLIIEKTGKKYTYTLGIFKTFKEAELLYNLLGGDELKDLDIGAYFNNVKIPDTEVSFKTRTLPDLSNYLFFKEGG